MRCLEQKGEEEGQRYALSGRWQSFDSLPLGGEPVCSGTGAPRVPRLKPNFK
jgi:hypothetical protein